MHKYGYSSLYVILTAASALIVNHVVEILPPTYALLCSVLLAIGYFHAVNLDKLGLLYRNALKDPSGWLQVNLSVLVVWLCDFYGLYYTDPVDFMFIFFATTAGCAFLVQSVGGRPKALLLAYRVSAAGVAILIGMVCAIPGTQASVRSGLIGNACAIAAGMAAYLYIRWSHDFAVRCSLTSSQLLAVRFYVLVIVAAVAVWSLPSSAEIHWTFESGVAIVLTALLTFILPLYAGQRAIMQAGPELNAMFIASTPLVLCIFEWAVNGRFVATRFVFGILLAGLIMVPKVLELSAGRKQEGTDGVAADGTDRRRDVD